MAKLFDKENIYKIKLELNKDEILKDIREVKKELNIIVKECTFELNKLELKRKDILVIKLHSLYKTKDAEIMKKQLEKQLHRKVLLINDNMDISHIISYKKK